MNILVTFNSDYLMPARVLIRSILENNSGEITIFILHHSLSEEEQNILRRDVETNGRARVVFLVADEQFRYDNPSCPWISEDTYLRLMAQELLPQDVKRYLYLDSDIVVLGCLEEFYHQDMEGNLIAALGYGSPKEVSDDPEAEDPVLFLTEPFYFLANVMLVDLEAVRKEVNPSVYFRLNERMEERLRGKDQDILNIVFNGRAKDIDKKYNTSTMDTEDYDNVRILHYGGSHKPWKYSYDLPGAEIFWEYASKFPEYKTLRDGILTAQEQFKADRKREAAARIIQNQFQDREKKAFEAARQLFAEPVLQVSMDSNVRLKEEIDIIDTAADTLVVPYGELLHCYYGFFRVNVIGKYIIVNLKEQNTGKKIAASLSEESGISIAKAEECTQAILNKLNRFKLLDTDIVDA